jgi:hypothetical protein
MISKFLMLAAASFFLAFSGLSIADLEGARSAARAAPVDLDVADPAATIDPSAAAPGSLGQDAIVPPAADFTTLRVDAAMSRLGRAVARQSHPAALEYAFRAYFNYRAAHPEEVRKPYLYFVDFGLDSRTPRGYVFDMEALAIVEGPFAVAHGRGSVAGGAPVPTRFLNTKGSNATSLGLYVAEETYAFSGRSGGRAYRSIGLRLRGVSGNFNSAARERGIVVHGAPYVTATSAGRSEGCPAMEPRLAQKLIPRIAEGGLVFHFSPHDVRWMRGDPWAGLPVPSLALVP